MCVHSSVGSFGARALGACWVPSHRPAQRPAQRPASAHHQRILHARLLEGLGPQHTARADAAVVLAALCARIGQVPRCLDLRSSGEKGAAGIARAGQQAAALQPGVRPRLSPAAPPPPPTCCPIVTTWCLRSCASGISSVSGGSRVCGGRGGKRGGLGKGAGAPAVACACVGRPQPPTILPAADDPCDPSPVATPLSSPPATAAATHLVQRLNAVQKGHGGRAVAP